MKSSILIASLLIASSQQLFALTSIKDLKVDCKIKAQVTSVNNIKYNPGSPAKFRLNGIAPSLSFQANMDILEQSEGCAILKNKYDIYLGNLSAFGSKYPADPNQISSIEALVGQVFEMNLEQYFGFTFNNEWLPLFPLIHEEILNFSFQSNTVGFNIPLSFNLNWVYSISKTENLSDIQKLALAEKIKPYLFFSDYQKLFLQLEPVNQSLKKSYANLIWGAFNELKQKSNDHRYLQFNVGGNGSDLGKPLAVKFNTISHLPHTMSSVETIQLLTDFPVWIFAGYTKDACLNFSAAQLEKSLINIKAKLPILTYSDKYLMKDAMLQITGQFIGAWCIEGKVTTKSKELAQLILKEIN